MTSDKAPLRRSMRQQRKALNFDAQLATAQAVSHHITQLPGWSDAGRIALYLANDGEVDTAPLAAVCRSSGKQLFLPVITDSGTLEFASWTVQTVLQPNRYGILEPDSKALRCSASLLDVVIMPVVAWDRSGGRLGMGGGYYDRTFADVQEPLLVGLAHAAQQVPCIRQDLWDVKLDFALTEDALHHCKGLQESEENPQS